MLQSLALFAALSATPAQVPASPSPALRHNLQCIGAASVLQHLNKSRGDDADRQKTLLAFTLYYVGKVKGAQPEIDLAEAIRSLGPPPADPQERKDLVTGCIDEFRQIGEQLSSTGKALLDKSKP
ncbi:hypothetical protein EV664_101252 [Stakelama pacifica]|uniref:Uncharacterized protein n=1 Tax=Stakelama pacifica TaxID=517720 RepID=A0A4R6FXG3_9SPHN|nr:hypothetical protein EV664_101252 [Stakelama pacifica]GGO90349.1 hypothetical protein GCM10011329_02460 [Stakelama pacifica]